MDSDPIWKPFSLTHVEYIAGDHLGYVLAISSLLPIFVVVGFITLILFRRDLHTITFFIGILFNESVNIALKQIIAEPRPFLRDHLYTAYGMPSSHAQFSWFFSVYCILFVIFRLRHNYKSALEFLWKAVVCIGLLMVSCMVAYSRIYLLYHTWSQIICGCIAGAFLGSFWFTIIHNFLSSYFPAIATWSVCEFLMIRDTSLIPNVLWFEYANARAENRTRNRKLVSMKSQ